MGDGRGVVCESALAFTLEVNAEEDGDGGNAEKEEGEGEVIEMGDVSGAVKKIADY